ncbi:MAG: hypothetical protein WHV28_02775 [Bacteroidota bacterium]
MEKSAFSKAIKQNTEIICNSLNFSGKIAIDELLECADLPDVYKTMITAERELWIFKEKMRFEANPFFDFYSKTNLCFEFETLLKQISVVPFDNLFSFIESFVKLRLNFLCRPRTTLKYFIFRESLTVSYEQFLKYLAYFSDYDYLYQSFYDFVAKETEQGKTTISIYEFENKLELFDNTFVLNLDENELTNLLEPIFQFFSDDTGIVKAPTDALIMFFLDKKLNYLAYLIENQHKNAEISRFELVDLLRNNLMKVQTAELVENLSETKSDVIEFVSEISNEVYDFQNEQENLAEEILQIEEPDSNQPEPSIPDDLSDISDDNITDLNSNLNVSFDNLIESEISENFDNEINLELQEDNIEELESQLSSDEYALLELMNENLEDNLGEEFPTIETAEQSDLVNESISVSSETNLFDEELQIIDSFIPEEENYDVIYEAENQIIQKAISFIAGDEHFSVDLPIAIENTQELPSFEFKGDLSSSLSDFLNKLLDTKSTDENLTPDFANNESDLHTISNDVSNTDFSSTQSEPSESDLLQQFAATDFDEIDNLNAVNISELNDIASDVDNFSANQTTTEYEFDVDMGELVEQKIEDETIRTALESYELNDELLSNMKEKEKKINVGDEEIDIDLLLLNKKEKDNEIC